MDLLGRPRPPVSRETRLLFVTVLISLVALWVLARVRFADRAMASNPVSPVLTQLAAPPVFDQLSGAVSQLNRQLTPLLIGVHVVTSGSTDRATDTVAALRLPGGVAIALIAPSMTLDPAGPTPEAAVVARDPASGLTILSVPTDASLAGGSPLDSIWTPRRPSEPRYLVAASVTSDGVASRPVFVGSLGAIDSRVWNGTLRALPADNDFKAGALLFTTDGAFAGIVTRAGGALALVPGDLVSYNVDRLRRQGRREYGWLGVETQELPSGVLLPGQAGLVVTRVDPEGPAATHLTVGDVIVGVGDASAASHEHWLTRTARMAAGDTVQLRVARGDTIETVTLTAAAPQSTAVEPRALGLTLRAVPRRGAEVLRVEPGSAAALAGIEAGDVIVSVGGRPAPGPADVRRVFAEAGSDRSLVVAVARGADHRVLVIDKR